MCKLASESSTECEPSVSLRGRAGRLQPLRILVDQSWERSVRRAWERFKSEVLEMTVLENGEESEGELADLEEHGDAQQGRVGNVSCVPWTAKEKRFGGHAAISLL
jgi:hypothetical protein